MEEQRVLDIELDDTIHKTAKCFIMDSYGRVLLVHEKPDARPKGKPAGWGPAGGSVMPQEKLDLIFGEILKLMEENQILQEEGFMIHVPRNIAPRLAAIRETLEETGYLVKIVGPPIEFEKTYNHAYLLYPCVILAGQLRKRTTETDDAAWFFTDRLPAVDVDGDESMAIYPKNRQYIKEAIVRWNLGQKIDDGIVARNMGYVEEENATVLQAGGAT